MKVAKITPNDTMRKQEIEHLVFHGALDRENARKEIETRPASDWWWGYYTDEGELAAVICSNPDTMRFDGHTVPMSGIGGVGTMPEYRNEGCIRSIFKELLPDNYKNGYVFSGLYPFCHAFYRKVGFETTWFRSHYRIPTSQLTAFRFAGKARIWQRDKGAAEFLRIYEKYAENYNCALTRTQESMARRLPEDPYAERKYAYLLDDKAYVIWSWEEHGEGHIMQVQDFAYDGREGLMALFGFLGRFTADYRYVEIDLPPQADPRNLVPDPCEVKVKQSCTFMTRVVNVQKALSLMTRPKGCRFTVKTEDKIIPENSGTWLVTDSGAEKTEAAPDFETTVNRLAPMILGHLDWESAKMTGDVKIHGNEDTLSSVFTKKEIMIAEAF